MPMRPFRNSDSKVNAPLFLFFFPFSDYWISGCQSRLLNRRFHCVFQVSPLRVGSPSYDSPAMPSDTLATPAVREHLTSLNLEVNHDIVCYHCFHSFVHNAVARTLAPGENFSCSYSDTSSLSCDDCRKRKAVCEQVGLVAFGSGVEVIFVLED